MAPKCKVDGAYGIKYVYCQKGLLKKQQTTVPKTETWLVEFLRVASFGLLGQNRWQGVCYFFKDGHQIGAVIVMITLALAGLCNISE